MKTGLDHASSLDSTDQKASFQKTYCSIELLAWKLCIHMSFPLATIYNIYHTYVEKYVFNSQFGKTRSLSIPQDLEDFLSGFGNKAIGGVGISIYVQYHTYPF